MTLSGCERCGATGWVITLMAPVYVSVDADGSVRRVRVNDEAVSVWDTGGQPERDDLTRRFGRLYFALIAAQRSGPTLADMAEYGPGDGRSVVIKMERALAYLTERLALAGVDASPMPALVTCDGDDHEAPADVARAVILAADACTSWPGWELGA